MKTCLNDLDLTALMCSRVCHDLISPVGAITNGLEVLDEETDAEMHKMALDLVRKSAQQASAKLQFCRLAFGAAGSADAVLTQIIFEEESKGVNLLPIPFLRQLIGFYGDKLQAFIPNYLEFSLESLRKEQERFQRQVMESFASDQLKAIEEQARTNITLFQEALQVFNPFSALAQREKQEEPEPQRSEKKEEKKEGAQEDLDAIRAEMAALRRELGAIRREKP